MRKEERSFCRVCGGSCGVVLTVEDDRIVSVRGDKAHPITSGYVCIKGLQADAQYYGPQRLLHPQKRGPDGTFSSIPLEDALDEIAEQLREIIDHHGPEAVGLFFGTGAYLNVTAMPALSGWMNAIGSPSKFSSMTIDQSAKFIAKYRMGFWSAGMIPFAEADVWMFVGMNPLVSMNGLAGFPTLNPQKHVKEAKARGMKFIVIDPRKTEMARYADIHLQPKAGEDVAMAGGLLNIILSEGWYDREFCAKHVAGLDELRRAVSAFTPELVERRTQVAPVKVREAAELFALQCQRGAMSSGTGPSMGPHSNIAEHLYACLNVVCGRFLRAGDRISNPGLMSKQHLHRAQVIRRDVRPWEKGPKSRSGHGTLMGEMMSGVMADEILRPGKGQIRCVIAEGGNPVAALPDMEKSARAFSSLDLLVAIDPYLNTTSRLAHYILPTKLPYERHDLPSIFYETLMFPEPFAQYANPVVPPPEGSEVIDDWYFYWATAKRLGLNLTYDGAPLDMVVPPTSEEIIALTLRRGVLSFEEMQDCTRGKIFDLPAQYVEPADPATADKFDLIPDDVARELRAALEDINLPNTDDRYPYRLAVRRMRDVMNSGCRDLPRIAKRVPYNPAFIHPDDLSELGFRDGEAARIESDHGAIEAILEADETMLPGVISMSHGWGAVPDDKSGVESGSSVNLLVSSSKNVEVVNAMPRFGGIPIRIVPASSSAG